MNTTPDYAEKIGALLRKATDPAATPAEAKSYTEKAEALMVKWGVSDAEAWAAARGAGQQPTEKIVQRKIRLYGTYYQAQQYLAFDVGGGLGAVRVLKANGYERHVGYTYFIGFESDVARAEALWESLWLQGMSALNAWWRTYTDKRWMGDHEKFKARRDFLIAFGSEVRRRLRAQRQQQHQAVSSSTALALRDRGQAVDEWLNSNMTVKKGRGLEVGYAGTEAGRRAGREANLGGTQVGQGSGRTSLR